MKFLVIQLLLLSSITTYLLTPKYLPQHPILENSPTVFFYLNVTDEVSHPHKTIAKTTGLYI